MNKASINSCRLSSDWTVCGVSGVASAASSPTCVGPPLRNCARGLNFEIAEIPRERAMKEWTRYGRLRETLEHGFIGSRTGQVAPTGKKSRR
jgi:hypothetical protein